MMSLRKTNGTVQRTIRVDDGPEHILFDGASLWITNTAADAVDKLTPWR